MFDHCAVVSGCRRYESVAFCSATFTRPEIYLKQTGIATETPRLCYRLHSSPSGQPIRPAHLKHLRAVTVVRKQVGAAAQGASDTVRRTQRLESGSNGRRRSQTLQSLEIHSKTSDMGRGHGRAGQARGSRVSSNVARQDGHTGREDVDAGAVVGERGGAEARVGGCDGEGVGCVGGGLLGDGEGVAVLVTVAGGDDREHALCVGRLDRVGPCGGGLAAEGHVDDRARGAALGGDVVDGPVETSKDGRGSTLRALEHLDGDQVGLLGNTVGRATDGTGNVGAVAEGVSVGSADGVVAKSGTTAKLSVSNDDTGVNDVGVGVLPSGGVIDV